MKKVIGLILALIVLGTGYYHVYFNKGQENNNESIGGVSTGQEYNATSTPFDTAQVKGQIVKGAGALGSVVITSTGDLKFRLLDATSTVMLDRPSDRRATSSAEIAVINTATAGTYVFDISFTDGLYLDVISGNTGTTTITYR